MKQLTGLLKELGSQEAEHQEDGDLAEDESLESLHAHQCHHDRRQRLELQLDQQQQRQQHLLLHHVPG